MNQFQLNINSDTQPTSEFEAFILNVFKDGTSEDIAHVLDHFASYLKEVDNTEELKDLLTSFPYLRGKLLFTNVDILLNDFSDSIQSEELKTIFRTLQSTRHILQNDKNQLTTQLIGKNQNSDLPIIKQLIQSAEYYTITPWFKPLRTFGEAINSHVVVSMAEHSGKVQTIQLSNESNSIITIADDASIKVWNEAGILISDFHLPTKRLKQLIQLDSDNLLISLDYSHNIILWDIEQNSRVAKIQHGFQSVSSIMLEQNSKDLFVGSDTGVIKIIDVIDNVVKQEINAHTSYVTSIVQSKDGRFIATGSADSTVKVWFNDGNKYNLLTTFEETISEQATSLSISTTGQFIISSGKGISKVWDVFQQTLYFDAAENPGMYYKGEFTSDGKKFLSYTQNEIAIWDLQTKSKVFVSQRINEADGIKNAFESPKKSYIVIHQKENVILWNTLTEETSEFFTNKNWYQYIDLVEITSDEKFLLMSSVNSSITSVWDLETNQLHKLINNTLSRVSCVKTNLNKNRIIAGFQNGLVQIWDLQETMQTVLDEQFAISSSAFLDASEDHFYSFGQNNGSIVLIDSDEQSPPIEWKGHTDKVYSLIKSVRQDQIISSSRDNTIKIWDVNQQTLQLEIVLPEGDLTEFFEASDGSQIVATSRQGKLFSFDRNTGDILHSIQAHSGTINKLEESMNGLYIISTSKDGSIKIFDINSLELISEKRAFGQNIIYIQDTSEANIISASRNGQKIIIWDIQTGQTVMKSQHLADQKIFTSLEDSTGTSEVFAGDEDGTIYIVDKKTGKHKQSIQHHTDRISGLKTFNSGTYLLSASHDSSIKLFNLHTQEIVTALNLDEPIISFSFNDKTRTLHVVSKNNRVYNFEISNVDMFGEM